MLSSLLHESIRSERPSVPPHPREHSLIFWCLFYKSPALLSISSARVPPNILYNSELRPSSQRRFYRCQTSSLCSCECIQLTKRRRPVTQLLLPPQSSLHILQVLAQTIFLDKPPIYNCKPTTNTAHCLNCNNHIYISQSLSGNLSLICMCLLLLPSIKKVIYLHNLLPLQA